MSRKQRIIEEARRILGTFESAAEAVGTAATSAAPFELDPGLEGLESLAAPLPGARGGGAGIGELPSVERAVAADTQRQVQIGLDAMKKMELGREDEISEQGQRGLEAIILLTGRPAILIQAGDFMEPPPQWADLKRCDRRSSRCIQRVGRIEVANNPNFDWLGTGLLAGADTVITNRHVAMEFAQSSAPGQWKFRAPMTASRELQVRVRIG